MLVGTIPGIVIKLQQITYKMSNVAKYLQHSLGIVAPHYRH